MAPGDNWEIEKPYIAQEMQDIKNALANLDRFIRQHMSHEEEQLQALKIQVTKIQERAKISAALWAMVISIATSTATGLLVFKLSHL